MPDSRTGYSKWISVASGVTILVLFALSDAEMVVVVVATVAAILLGVGVSAAIDAFRSRRT